MIELISFSV